MHIEGLEEFIIADTETTGCNPMIDRITEIAFYHIKNGCLIKSWSSLINPQQSIPPYVQQLTGISNLLVRGAPSFTDIAHNLFHDFQGKILVAHNAKFDYGFLKNEFKRCGFSYRAKTLCTVKLSRLLFPEENKHSLDAIIHRTAIKVNARHRAMADTEALFMFLKFITENLSSEKLGIAIKEILAINSLPTHITKKCLNAIPKSAGVYRFYNEDGALLYIGKSISLRDRVLSHFASHHTSNKEMQLAQQVHHIDWIETAGELGALN